MRAAHAGGLERLLSSLDHSAAEQALSQPQRQLNIPAPLALLAAFVLAPDSTAPFRKEDQNAFARLQASLNFGFGDEKRQLYKLTPALVPTHEMAQLAASFAKYLMMEPAPGAALPEDASQGALSEDASQWEDIAAPEASSCQYRRRNRQPNARRGHTAVSSPAISEDQRRQAEAELMSLLDEEKRVAALVANKADARQRQKLLARRQYASTRSSCMAMEGRSSGVPIEQAVGESLTELTKAPSMPIDAADLQAEGWVIARGRKGRRPSRLRDAVGTKDGSLNDLAKGSQVSPSNLISQSQLPGPEMPSKANPGTKYERGREPLAMDSQSAQSVPENAARKPESHNISAMVFEIERLRAQIEQEREEHKQQLANMRLEYETALEKASQRIQSLRLRLFIFEAAEEEGGEISQATSLTQIPT